MVGPLSGLLGVVVGSLITHKLGQNQERKRLKLEKLQELTSLSRRLRDESVKFHESFHKAIVIDEDSCQIDLQVLPNPDSINAEIRAIEFLVKVHCPELNEQCESFVNFVIGLCTEIQFESAAGIDSVQAYEAIKKSLLKSRSRVSVEQRTLENKAIKEARKL